MPLCHPLLVLRSAAASSGPPSGYSAWWQVSSLGNGTVSSWTATGTSPPTITQAIGANQPTKSASPNILTYNGTSDYLGDASTATFTAAFTVGIKFKLSTVPTGIGNWQSLLHLFKSGGGDGMIIGFVPGAGGYAPITVSGKTPITGSVGTTSVTLDNTTAHTLIVTYDGTTANNVASGYQVFYDGATQSLTPTSTLVAITTNRVGALDNGGTPGNYFNGLHYDIVVYSSVLSAGNITSLNTFLAGL